MSGIVQLGIGLIGIGREWGFKGVEVPSEAAAMQLLDTAFEVGIRYYDTAASYGWSEERLGRFLRKLTPGERDGITVATKFGETWDFENAQPVVDHSFEALKRSLDRSIGFLGRIDVLQLHKTSPEVLRSDDLARAWEYARAAGISRLGASVSDVVSGRMALAGGAYEMLQLPFHRDARQFGEVLDAAKEAGKWIATNRPFGMGKHLYGQDAVDKTEAFRFVLRRLGSGVILTGTKSPEHLGENWLAFSRAVSGQS